MVKHNELLDLLDPALKKKLFNQPNDEENFVIEKARRNGETIKYVSSDRMFYLTSKFDPVSEAEKYVSISKEKVEDTDNLIILGAGLGYILSAVIEIKPELNLYIIEPDHELLKIFVTSDLSKKVLKKIKYISDKVAENEMNKIIHTSYKLGGNINYLVTPGFSEIYSKEEKVLGELLLTHLKNKRNSLATNMAFQERWALNAIKNFPEVLKTPNAIELLKTDCDLSKPAFLIAAGPSLNYEFEHLKVIKEKKLGYIFAVGSAINALIRNEIKPDFFCTYDPQSHNYKVSEVLSEHGIADITMLFGSSVGYETLQQYNGLKAHFITSQDRFSTHLLKNSGENENIINDAPSIAVMTYQLLSKAGFKQIVLVGQNLSFEGKQRYAKGIEYESGSSIISEKDERKLKEVDSVSGTVVYSDDGYNSMRKELELYINRNPQVKTINTTVNGARINGAEFVELKEVVSTWLSVIHERELPKSELTIPQLSESRVSNLEKDFCEFNQLIQKLSKNIDQLKNAMQPSLLERKLRNIDLINEGMKENLYYQTVLSTSMKHELTVINNKIKKTKTVRSFYERKKLLINAFEIYLYALKNKDQLFKPVITEMIDQLKEKDFLNVIKR